MLAAKLAEWKRGAGESGNGYRFISQRFIHAGAILTSHKHGYEMNRWAFEGEHMMVGIFLITCVDM